MVGDLFPFLSLQRNSTSCLSKPEEGLLRQWIALVQWVGSGTQGLSPWHMSGTHRFTLWAEQPVGRERERALTLPQAGGIYSGQTWTPREGANPLLSATICASWLYTSLTDGLPCLCWLLSSSCPDSFATLWTTSCQNYLLALDMSIQLEGNW